MPFAFEELDFPGLVMITPRLFADERGAFLETFKLSDFAEAGITRPFVQDNLSRSSRGVIRGLHMQVGERAQDKLVWVPLGAVFDVVVDLRPDSPTYGRWRGMQLSDRDLTAVYIPAGFAHGFQALTDDTRFAYKCTAEYSRDAERGIRFDDPDLAIVWPVSQPIVSQKDRALPGLREFEEERS